MNRSYSRDQAVRGIFTAVTASPWSCSHQQLNPSATETLYSSVISNFRRVCRTWTTHVLCLMNHMYALFSKSTKWVKIGVKTEHLKSQLPNVPHATLRVSVRRTSHQVAHSLMGQVHNSSCNGRTPHRWAGWWGAGALRIDKLSVRLKSGELHCTVGQSLCRGGIWRQWPTWWITSQTAQERHRGWGRAAA